MTTYSIYPLKIPWKPKFLEKYQPYLQRDIWKSTKKVILVLFYGQIFNKKKFCPTNLSHFKLHKNCKIFLHSTFHKDLMVSSPLNHGEEFFGSQILFEGSWSFFILRGESIWVDLPNSLWRVWGYSTSIHWIVYLFFVILHLARLTVV